MIKINIINQYDDKTYYQQVIIDIIHAAETFFDFKLDQVVNIVLLSDDDMHQMNHQYRHIDRPTDVLSFENQDSDEELGDIFISVDKVHQQAKDYQHSFERELAFLTLHGFLHCMGYDHHDEESEEKMFHLQDKIIENTRFRREDHYEK